MKQSKNFREVQTEYKETVVGLCLVCKKATSGYYARFGDNGVCSKICMKVQDSLPLYQEHPAEAFEKLHNL